MRKLFIGIWSVLILSGCNPKNTESFSGKIQTQVNFSTLNGYKNSEGFKHYCDSLEIPYDLELWQLASFRDYETKGVVDEYLYMKVDDVFRLNITIQDKDTTYCIIHRITQ